MFDFKTFSNNNWIFRSSFPEFLRTKILRESIHQFMDRLRIRYTNSGDDKVWG